MPTMEATHREGAGADWRPTTAVPTPGLDPTAIAPGTTARPVDPPTVRAEPVHRPAPPPPAPAPAHWGAPAPVAVPAGTTRRRWVTLPLAAAAVGFASAEPVVLVPVLGLVVGPALATVGDALTQPDRHQAWALAWWARNVAVGAARSVGGLVVLAIALTLWFGTQAIDLLDPAGPWVLRLGGGAAAALVLQNVARGGPRYRSDVSIDTVVARLLPGGRPTVAAAVTVLVSVAIACLGLLLRPEAWPIA